MQIEQIKTGTYRHYKGKLYEVVGMALHSETLESMVIYAPLYEIPEIPKGIKWVRPAAMFLETVEVEGQHLPRFEYIVGQ